MEYLIYLAVLVVVGGIAGYIVLRKPAQLPPPAEPQKKVETSKEQVASPAPETTKQEKTDKPALKVVDPVLEEPPVEPAEEPEVQLDAALSKTRSSIWGRISQIFTGQQIDDDILEEIEEVLYTSDLGPATVQRLMESVNSAGATDLDSLKVALKTEMSSIFSSVDSGKKSDLALLDRLRLVDEGPTVWMVVGVNGAGKTTTIGKIAAQLTGAGKKVMIVAGDTFRAAAVEQLQIWSERAGASFYSNPDVTDPSAIAFQGCEKALSEKVDIILIDTAGRLHTQSNLMEELRKMKRVISKKVPESPHEVIIVLDSNSGQNALIQAKEFHSALDLTGVVLTKLDGSAKGGVAVGVACELELPIKMIGVGEKVKDLRAFSAQEFVDSIL